MTSQNTLEGMSGREASQLRRRMLSQGKAALPAASERIRTGFREADMQNDVPVRNTTVEAPVVSDRVVSPAPGQRSADTGREASIERRKAMSKGKAALPAAAERIRSGFREAEMPADQAAAPTAAFGKVVMPEGGRDASIARRKALSLGKSALPAASERTRSGFREAAMPTDIPTDMLQADTDSVEVLIPVKAALSGREIAQMYREKRANNGRGSDPVAGPSCPTRQGEMTYPAKVPSVTTAVANATVTGLSYATGRSMTGAEAGFDKPLTGTQYVGGSEGSYRAAPAKVGRATTEGGQSVSGTMVRSGVRVTGDEDSADIYITGNADQTLDAVEGGDAGAIATAAQFARQSQPHGASVFGTNLGRSARFIGSRSRETERPVEQTLAGHAVSGTAIGRSARVTGDENGAARSLTGSQYLASAADQATLQPEDGRTDPASGGKVTASQTWGGQTVTGPEMEHDGRVTGSEHGTCQPLTGTPYYGASGTHGWCDADAANAAGKGQTTRVPRAITGDVPLHDPMVSGTGRGADRDITGSRYFVAEEHSDMDEADRVTQSIAGFSVMSPQRETHLSSRANQNRGSAITGTFARGEGKVTGNSEFHAPGRSGHAAARPAHGSVTGEGSTRGPEITGSAWKDDSRVTGTEDYIASGRNPSERGGRSHAFAGAQRFKSKAPNHDPVSPVTGATGGTPDASATVTLSGGAAG